VQAYRQGQTREVVVYHMVGAGTLEEHIHRRSLQKTALAAYAQPSEILFLLFYYEILYYFFLLQLLTF
jgi:SNF2 family DNA or RNA helicase